MNVLIGPNGAGKSNFISLFALLAAMMEGRLQRFVVAAGGAEALLFGGRKGSERVEAAFQFGANGYRCVLVPEGGRLLLGLEETKFVGKSEISRRTVRGDGLESGLREAVGDDGVAPYLLEAVRSWRVYHFHDTSASSGMRNDQAVRDNLALKPDGGNIGPFLRHLRERHETEHGRIVNAVRLVAPWFGDFIYRPAPGERMELEWHHASDRATVRGPRQLSDGTLRFICLATLLLQPLHLQPAMILLDEPELGLHPYAVAVFAALLEQASRVRQFVVSTQSPELVSELSPEDVVTVFRQGDESRFVRLESGELKEWLEDYNLGELWKMNVVGDGT